ncbi:phage tail protein [Draconibacterium halophilum]|uniref:Phage tail protein n=1 Tax=Draconibacterium halophilum TaxID=2706887 RepID=A0A6C0RCV8_9BACT|nr:tail fiber protein [Draconibacterium halophilum]QIA08488.1 phage tail protein [Draconibacterium halophilum]
MSEPFIAEIRIFAGNFAPRGWSFCNGQLLPISQNTALFSLIGTTFGGDGRTTTALPNLQGRAPMHPGRGPGLTDRRLGQIGGTETVTLSSAQIPSHNHLAKVNSNGTGNSNLPEGNVFSNSNVPDASVFSGNTANTAVADLTTTGGGQAHNNMQPFIAVNYIIALTGLYPSRS